LADSLGLILAAHSCACGVIRIGFVQGDNQIDANRKFSADPVIEKVIAVGGLEQEVIYRQCLSDEKFS
jgi:hypothetical protein